MSTLPFLKMLEREAFFMCNDRIVFKRKRLFYGFLVLYDLLTFSYFFIYIEIFLDKNNILL